MALTGSVDGVLDVLFDVLGAATSLAGQAALCSSRTGGVPRHIQTSRDGLHQFRIEIELDRRADRALGWHEISPPRWLTSELGSAPSNPEARATWWAAARTIERHRLP